MAEGESNVTKSGGSGMMGALTDGLATLTRYSITLPFYPLRFLAEGVRGSLTRPLEPLAELLSVAPRAFLKGVDAAVHEITGKAKEGEPTLTRPGLLKYRDEDQDAVVIFIHGFYMNMENTWGDFPNLVVEDTALDGWDVFSLGYNTNFWLDIGGLWKASPPIDRLASLLVTTVRNEPIKRYKTIALVAHSMGGLVVQRALVDSKALRDRVSHINLYGTPSNGLKKAGFIKFWKRQIRDMAAGSEFVVDLRRRWSASIGNNPRFKFIAAAGDQDELVPPTSSLGPFAERFRAIIPGDHLSIANVSIPDDLGVQVLIGNLTDAAMPAGPWNSARVAVESRDFERAIEELWPHRSELDKDAVTTLAIALSSVGRQEEAIQVLREAKDAGTDQMGTLGGRLKRRWLRERKRTDAEESLKLYETALEQSEKEKNSEQAYYHAINVAFMSLAFRRDSAAARKYAELALEHCGKASESMWRYATEGEANLVLGHDDKAIVGYRKALDEDPEPWQIKSMYEQAVRVAEELNKKSTAERLQKLFREPDAVKDAAGDTAE